MPARPVGLMVGAYACRPSINAWMNVEKRLPEHVMSSQMETPPGRR